MIALGGELRNAGTGEPGAPALGIGLVQQGKVFEVSWLKGQAAAPKQRRVARRGQFAFQQEARIGFDVVGMQPLDRQIDGAVGEIRRQVRMLQAQVEAGVLLPKPDQPRRQPFKGEMGPHMKAEGPVDLVGTHQIDSPGDGGQALAHGRPEHLARRRQGERAALAVEKRGAEVFFQLSDLMAGGGLGDAELFGPLGKALMARHRLEGLQRV